MIRLMILLFLIKSSWQEEILQFFPCENSTIIVETFAKSNPPKYNLTILSSADDVYPKRLNLLVKYDSPAKTLSDHNWLYFFDDEKSFQGGGLLDKRKDITLTISPKRGIKLPNVISVKLNSEILCENFYKDVWDNYTDLVEEASSTPIVFTTESEISIEAEKCGRRNTQNQGFITSGVKSQPGDWPWHAAIYRLQNDEQKYICGGTLVSESLVITAAHCVMEYGSQIIPNRLLAVLGKYNFVGNNINVQEKKVFQIISHREFSPATLDNDIALLKLSSEVKFNDFVQPICIWKEIRVMQTYGVAVGWGATESGKYSEQLIETRLPFVADLTCIKSHVFFFSKLQSDGVFCAGFGNGDTIRAYLRTNVCNGDSGSGLYINKNEGTENEIWYLKGLVSLGIPKNNQGRCNPEHFTLFTDISYYMNFINENI